MAKYYVPGSSAAKATGDEAPAPPTPPEAPPSLKGAVDPNALNAQPDLGPLMDAAAKLGLPISVVISMAHDNPAALAKMLGDAGAAPPKQTPPSVGSALPPPTPARPALLPEEQNPQGFKVDFPGNQWPNAPADQGPGVDIKLAPGYPPAPTAAPPPATPPASVPPTASEPGVHKGKDEPVPTAEAPTPADVPLPTERPDTTSSADKLTAAALNVGKALSGVKAPAAPTPLPAEGVSAGHQYTPPNVGSLLANLATVRPVPSLKSVI
jgi:hypothetical protein